MSESTDEALLKRFVRGDHAALGELAERYEGPLLGLACEMLDGRRDLAADAVQNAWVRVIRHAKNFAGESSVRTWVYRIVINQCLDVRSKRSNELLKKRAGASAIASQEKTRPVDPARNGAVRAAVESLEPGPRVIVLLCYHHDLTHAQVADILGVPLGTVKSRLHAALVELRAKLNGENHS